MMPPATISIPFSRWFGPTGIFLVCAVILLIWSYRRVPRIGVVPKIAFCLKVLGVLVLLLVLLEPLYIGRRAVSGANMFAVLADNSSGMNVRDRGVQRTRGEILADVLDPADNDFLPVLAEDFELRRYMFDSRIRRTLDFTDLAFDGTSSAVSSALTAVVERCRNRQLAGILLMTDGNATDIEEKLELPADMCPVYPVVIGGDEPPRDIAVSEITVNQTAFEDSPVIICADIEANGYEGRTVDVELTDSTGDSVERRQLKIEQDEQKQTLRFRLRPERPGVLFYHLSAAEAVADANAATETEATSANNHRTIAVDRGAGPYRILYVSGRPNWEYKFLRRALAGDEQIQLVGLLRAARREPKYDWRGRSGESSNPLYRGFDNQQQEETEQYDQPVLVRLNTRDQNELSEGFPVAPEELFEYCAIILDDVEAGFFSYDQTELIRRFVGERGGGFLMLGGRESFDSAYNRTAIEAVLPVHLDKPDAAEVLRRIRLDLTRRGMLEPWARLRDNDVAESSRLAEMPSFKVANRVGAVKAGASVIAVLSGDGLESEGPALITQRFGRGRSAALAIGDIWRWGLKDAQKHADMDKFWRQTVRWLIADVPGRISLRILDGPDNAGRTVVLRVHARDEAFEPLSDAAVSVEVTDPNGETLELTAQPVSGAAGVFEAAYLPRLTGPYLAKAVVADHQGIKIGDAQTGWAADLQMRELKSVKANRRLLKEIAGRTGGEIVELDELGEFARKLPSRKAPVTEVWVRPLWDIPGVQPSAFLLAIACFVGEWALRRWKGLP